MLRTATLFRTAIHCMQLKIHWILTIATVAVSSRRSIDDTWPRFGDDCFFPVPAIPGSCTCRLIDRLFVQLRVFVRLKIHRILTTATSAVSS